MKKLVGYGFPRSNSKPDIFYGKYFIQYIMKFK